MDLSSPPRGSIECVECVECIECIECIYKSDK